jgi:hypothetical protein
LRQVLSFVDPGDGGLARRQSVATFVEAAKSVLSEIPRCTFQRLDCDIAKDRDKLDGIKYLDYYVLRGIEMGERVNFEPLM